MGRNLVLNLRVFFSRAWPTMSLSSARPSCIAGDCCSGYISGCAEASPPNYIAGAAYGTHRTATAAVATVDWLLPLQYGCCETENKIAECEFGSIVLAEHQLTKQSVAVRIISKELLQKEGKVRRLAKQIALHRKLHHLTIVRLLELIENDHSIYLVFEWVDG